MMSLFRRHKTPSEIEKAKHIRDLQFAEVEVVIGQVKKSIKMIEEYGLAEKSLTKGRRA